MKNSDEILRGIFLSPGITWLAERLRTRASRGESLTDGTLTKSAATDEERSALDSFLGRKSTRHGRNLTVTLAALTIHLRHAELANDLSDVVRACFGKIENKRELKHATAREWESIFSDARETLRHDEAGLQWVESIASDGLLKRFSKRDPATGRNLLQTALYIWNRMPYDGITLAELGGEISGDTHLLDRGHALSPLLLRGLKFRTSHDGNKGAVQRRRAWDAVGVVIDRLSSPVLTYNLRAQAGTVLGEILALHAEAKLPVYVTYQMLQVHGGFLFEPENADVFVVENPSIVESAASKLGECCRPLICTEGIPASAAKMLLRRLAQAGSSVHVRADFDWTGLRIVDQLLLSVPGAKPWKMDTETYREISGTVELSSGKRFSVPWCTDLSEEMAHSGFAIYEEQLTGTLLNDLRITK